MKLRPLTEAFAQRFRDFLPLADYPVRTGVHSSTAFAIRMAADWAEAFDPKLFDLMRAKCIAWYGGDRDCQAWEPSQDDFLSPALMEVECMRRVLEPRERLQLVAQMLDHVLSTAEACPEIDRVLVVSPEIAGLPDIQPPPTEPTSDSR